MMLTAHRVAAAVLLSSLLVCVTPRAYGTQGEGPAEFSFRSLDGGSISSSDLRGKVAVLIFGDARLRLARLTDGRRVITPWRMRWKHRFARGVRRLS